MSSKLTKENLDKLILEVLKEFNIKVKGSGSKKYNSAEKIGDELGVSPALARKGQYQDLAALEPDRESLAINDFESALTGEDPDLKALAKNIYNNSSKKSDMPTLKTISDIDAMTIGSSDDLDSLKTIRDNTESEFIKKNKHKHRQL